MNFEDAIDFVARGPVSEEHLTEREKDAIARFWACEAPEIILDLEAWVKRDPARELEVFHVLFAAMAALKGRHSRGAVLMAAITLVSSCVAAQGTDEEVMPDGR